ncbi:hypothetical protein [Aliidiomarina sanyensis]|uniref:Uncharacterized protein n=1 Tax=Aliidiomarina sanyensis TaxID=1249555 RepID=A0A432WIG1_9GAMM|nr:hypothetical protein [Aliidiomarina sanyensis]RUO33507.1 hypothetical protein CWE11_06615 [Aliidiomarina sanyensis]
MSGRHYLRGLLVAIAALVLAGCNTTGNQVASSTVLTPERVSIPEYLVFLDELEGSISEGEPRELNERELDQFKYLKGRLVTLIGDREDIEQMERYEQERLFNLHQRLQTVVIGDPSQQVICRREQSIGSNLRQTRCMTRAQADAERDYASRFFNDMVDSGMTPLPAGN